MKGLTTYQRRRALTDRQLDTVGVLLCEFLAVAEGPVAVDDIVHAFPELSGPQIADMLGDLAFAGIIEGNGDTVSAVDARWWLTAVGFRRLGLERLVSAEGMPS